MSITISTAITIVSISSRLGFSRPLAIMVSMSIISQMSIAIVSISISLSCRLGISRPLSIVVSKSMAIISTDTMAISIVAIIGTSISTCFSLPSSSCKQAEGNNSNGFHHFICLQAR